MGTRLERTLGLVFAVAMTAMTGYFTIVWPAQNGPVPADQAIVLAARTEAPPPVDAALAQPGAVPQNVSRGDAYRAALSGTRVNGARD